VEERVKAQRITILMGAALALAGCDGERVIHGPASPGGSGECPSNGGGVGGGGGFGVPDLPATPLVASRPPPPISGGTLAISADGKLAVAADPDRDKVYVIDLLTNAKQTIELDVGAEPGRVAFDGAGRAHIALRSSASLVQIDPVRATILRQTAICQYPRGITYQAEGDAMLVACADGHLLRLAAEDHAEQARTFLDLDLRDVVITKNQKTLVSKFRAAELLEVDGQGKEARRLSLASAKVRIPDFDPICGALVEKNVTQVPRIAWRTALDANGNALLLHQRSRAEEVATDVPGGYGGGGCSNVTETTISKISTGGTQTAGYPLMGATMAVDLAGSPDGRWFAVASAATALIAINGAVQLYSSSEVSQPLPEGCNGAAPHASLSFGAQATSVAFDAAGRLLVQSREPAQLAILDVLENQDDGAGYIVPTQLKLQAVIALDAESVRDTGHDLFHSDVGGGIACASCHPEGRDDGHSWDFAGVGLRRTQNISGGLKGSEPFHWDGDMTSFQHLVDEVMTARMGGFVVEPHFANSLLDWMDKLRPLKLSTPPTEAVARGKALFESSNCASCHSGSMLTNKASADVGTGGKFQVPSLVGLALRGPFMHDGCAKDLVGRFDLDCGGGDLHGTTSNLSEKQIADLAAYLSTL
jgi:mono/diheme cytochrome c family protein/DNA-binding beta-propeller fold protein YncE